MKALTKVDLLLGAFLTYGAGESTAGLRKSGADTAFLFNLKNVPSPLATGDIHSSMEISGSLYRVPP